LDHLRRPDGTKSREAGWDEREEIGDATRTGPEQQDRNSAVSQILLELDALIERDEYVERALGQPEQFAVRFTGEAGLGNRQALVTIH